MEDLSLQFLLDLKRVKIAKQKAASNFCMNTDMHVECQLLQAEIDEIDLIINERHTV